MLACVEKCLGGLDASGVRDTLGELALQLATTASAQKFTTLSIREWALPSKDLE